MADHFQTIPDYRGKLLVARPHILRDPMFAESVVYLYEQRDNMVLGLVLNKPSRMSIEDLQAMRGIRNSGALGKLYRGGPVSDQSLLLLHTDEWQSTNTLPVGNKLCLSSDELMLDKLADGNLPNGYRLMSGMSSWSGPQLYTEINKHKAWLVIEPSSTIFFDCDDGNDQWKSAIQLASSRIVESLF